jgi:hypothetical protein
VCSTIKLSTTPRKIKMLTIDGLASLPPYFHHDDELAANLGNDLKPKADNPIKWVWWALGRERDAGVTLTPTTHQLDSPNCRRQRDIDCNHHHHHQLHQARAQPWPSSSRFCHFFHSTSG